MGKRTLILLIVLLVALTFTAIETNETAKANLYVPYPEVSISPSFSNNSLYNIQNDSSQVTFNFTVKVSFGFAPIDTIESVKVECYIDDDLKAISHLEKVETNNFEYSFKTSYLTEGSHSIEAIVIVQHTFTYPSKAALLQCESGSSGKLFFVIEKPAKEVTPIPSISPFLVFDTYDLLNIALSSVVIVVVALVSLIYFKRHRKAQANK